jgi:hypothetical protein
MWIKPQSSLIGKILSPAVGLWLRSQVEQVEELEFHIQGKDQQIISGYIPLVSLNSRRAVYQGLQLGEVKLLGENIRINIGQIIKGKPLQLLEPIQVSGEVQLEEADLNASLSSFILTNAFTDLLISLLELNGISNPKQQLANYQITWQEVNLKDSEFILWGEIKNEQEQINPITIHASLELINAQTLTIKPIKIQVIPELSDISLQAFDVDLGTDVTLEQLSLHGGQLACCGRLLVRN